MSIKISQLSPADLPLDGSEFLQIIQAGENKRLDLSEISGDVEEAPQDFKQYVRRQGQWDALGTRDISLEDGVIIRGELTAGGSNNIIKMTGDGFITVGHDKTKTLRLANQVEEIILQHVTPMTGMVPGFNANDPEKQLALIQSTTLPVDPTPGAPRQEFVQVGATEADMLSLRASGTDVETVKVRIDGDVFYSVHHDGNTDRFDEAPVDTEPYVRVDGAWDLLSNHAVGGAVSSVNGEVGDVVISVNGQTTPTIVLDSDDVGAEPLLPKFVNVGESIRRDANGDWETYIVTAPPVTSVFGRTGAVVAVKGDYKPDDVGAEPTLPPFVNAGESIRRKSDGTWETYIADAPEFVKIRGQLDASTGDIVGDADNTTFTPGVAPAGAVDPDGLGWIVSVSEPSFEIHPGESISVFAGATIFWSASSTRYIHMPAAAPVTSVNSKTGAVVLEAADITDVDSSAQVDAKITAAIGAIDSPVDSVNGKIGAVVLVAADITDVDSKDEVNTKISTAIGAIDFPVDSVNSKTGAVVLEAADIQDVYSKTEVDTKISTDIGAITFPVTSVNTKTGAVVLDAADVGALSLGAGGTVAGATNFTGALTKNDNAVVDTSTIRAQNNGGLVYNYGTAMPNDNDSNPVGQLYFLLV